VSGFTSGGCKVDAAVTGCLEGSYGFSCTGSSVPSDTDSLLDCSAGTATAGGTEFCCLSLSAGVTPTCVSDSAVATNCQGQGASYGFSCSGADTPAQTFAYLTCSTATAGPNGASLYCCNAGNTGSSPTPSCVVSTSLECMTGMTGYSCTGGAMPPATVTCGAGSAAPDGSTSYCCGAPAPAACAADATVTGCQNGSTGYSCPANATPDASLNCGAGVAGAGGATNYCCGGTTTVTSACAANSSITGCQGGSSGYTCTGTATPDASLNCGAGLAGAAGDTDYCCGGTPGTCMADATVAGCAASSTGYSCTGTDSPVVGTPALECSVGTPGTNGVTDYCCFTNASTTCMQDSTVTGCAASSYGFSCTGTDSPAMANPTLTCSDGTAGNDGATLYCCQ